MPLLLVLFAIYVIIQLFLFGFSIAIGFLLHWLIPDVALGTGILTGMVATIAGFYFFTRLLILLKFPLFMEILDNSNNKEEVAEEEEEEEVKSPPRKRRSPAQQPIGLHWSKKDR